MCIYIYIINIHSTHIYYVNKNCKLMAINRLTALVANDVDSCGRLSESVCSVAKSVVFLQKWDIFSLLWIVFSLQVKAKSHLLQE